MNYSDTKEYLKRYLKARIPVITINSIEKNRVLRLVGELSKELNMKFSSYGMSEGLVDLNTNGSLTEEKTIMGVFDYISNEIKMKQNCNYILSDISDIDESTVVSRYLVDIIERAEKSSGVIIIITSGSVWSKIKRLGIGLTLEYPTEEELKETITNTIEPYNNQISVEWDDNDYSTAASCLQGLSEMEAKNIISSMIIRGNIRKEDLKELKFTKQKLFNDIAGLESIVVEEDLEIAGLDNLKNWLYEKKELMNPNKRDELEKRGIASPRGILLTGVPGCGKSLCSKAASKIFNVPLYRLDLATVQGEYVGQSERQLKEALDTAEYFSPCVLWIDEIEKGLNDNNSSVTSKMIGQFLFWLQENKKPVFVIASANSVEDLPPELIRKGRFDEIFFVDLPKKEEREGILKLYAKKYLRVQLTSPFLDQLVELSEGYSSSDIEATMRAIAYKLIAVPDTKITENLIRDSLQDVVSLSKINPEKIEEIRNWGKQRAYPASK